MLYDMYSIFAGFGNIFNEIIKHHCFHSISFFSELNCHFQNYQCPGHFFSRKTSGEFVYEHLQHNVCNKY